MQILRLVTLFIALALGSSVATSLLLEHYGHVAGGETITDWGLVICGQRFGLVEYRGWSEHGDFGEMCTVLQLGRVKLLLAIMEIYHVLPLICTAVVLFFSLGLFGLVRVPAFGLWLRSIVTVRTLLLSALVVAIGGSAFVGLWFSQPPQWQKIRRGMSRQEVLVSMPDWVADMHCTDRSDWVHRDRYLLEGVTNFSKAGLSEKDGESEAVSD